MDVVVQPVIVKTEQLWQVSASLNKYPNPFIKCPSKMGSRMSLEVLKTKVFELQHYAWLVSQNYSWPI